MIIFKLFMNVFMFAVFGLMANDDTPNGLRVHGPCLRVTRYSKDASAGVIGIGSVVKLATDGYIEPIGDGESVLPCGVALKYSAASTADDNIPVADHPHQRFVVQDDGVTTSTIAFKGANGDVVNGTVNTTTGKAVSELNSTVGTTGELRIEKLAKTIYPSGVVNAWGANADLIVTIAEHQFNTDDGI